MDEVLTLSPNVLWDYHLLQRNQIKILKFEVLTKKWQLFYSALQYYQRYENSKLSLS